MKHEGAVDANWFLNDPDGMCKGTAQTDHIPGLGSLGKGPRSSLLEGVTPDTCGGRERLSETEAKLKGLWGALYVFAWLNGKVYVGK